MRKAKLVARTVALLGAAAGAVAFVFVDSVRLIAGLLAVPATVLAGTIYGAARFRRRMRKTGHGSDGSHSKAHH